MKGTLLLGMLLLLMFFQSLPAQDLSVYRLVWRELENKKKIAFVSLSESYPLSEHPDSSAVPNVSSLKIEDAEYLKLTGTYRKRFLVGTHTSEADRVFIYDYSIDSLLTFLVKDIDVVASLSGYGGRDRWPYSQDDYQIGFSIPTMYLKGFADYYRHAFVYVGKVNPFVRGQMKPVHWEQVEPASLAAIDSTFMDTTNKHKYEVRATYRCESSGFKYILQDLYWNNYFLNRRLRVIETKSQSIVCERMYYDGEGSSFAPLNSVEPNYGNDINQWTGKLFKNKPPVVFGFEYLSFGCNRITFLKPSEKDIYLRCDNRH